MPRCANKLLGRLDFLCVQNEEYAKRFSHFVSPSRIAVCGNFKSDQSAIQVDTDLWNEILEKKEQRIAIACTHEGEEEALFDQIVGDNVFVFLAPRHPERFEAIAKMLQAKKIPFFRFSRPAERSGEERVLLVDAMGQLPICYCLSQLAILGGSFCPGIGGHNLLEPLLYGVPVFFGEHTEKQKELAKRLLDEGAGQKVSYETVQEAVKKFFKNPSCAESMRQAAIRLIASQRGAVKTTLDALGFLL